MVSKKLHVETNCEIQSTVKIKASLVWLFSPLSQLLCFFPSSEENPFNIDEKAMALDEKEDEQRDGEEEEKEDGAEKMEEDQMDQPGEESSQEPKTEGEEEEEGEGEKAEGDKDSAEKDEEEEEDKEDRGQEAGKDEDLTTPTDKGNKPKVCMPETKCTYEQRRCPYTWFYTWFYCCVTYGACNVYRRRRRRRELGRMRSSQSQLRGRSTTQTVRLESRMFRATWLWSWQERLQREIKPRRYSTLCQEEGDRQVIRSSYSKLNLQKTLPKYLDSNIIFINLLLI